MTDTHTLSGLPASVRELTLDVTSLAHSVCFAASVPVSARGGEERATIDAWETLTGLHGEAAITAARTITRHPLPVTAAVVPF